MGIRFACPNGHKLNVKSELAGRRAICPQCGAKIIVPETDEAPVNEVSPQLVGGDAATIAAPIPQAHAAPLGEAASADASPTAVSSWPSLEIALTPSEVAQPVAVGPVVPAIDATAIPESIVVTTPAGSRDIAPVAAVADTYELRLERRRRNQMYMSVLLLMTVVSLAGILAWVLWRNTQPPPAETLPEEESSARSDVGAPAEKVADCIRHPRRRTILT